MIPFVPHLAHESLEILNCKNVEIWPKINKFIKLEKIKMVIQVNGKTRDVVDIKKDLSEEEIFKITMNETKAKKFLKGKKINKRIFVKNKIVNYLIKI